MQYSFLPSWLSFLVDKGTPRQPGRRCSKAVDAIIKQLPDGKRPNSSCSAKAWGPSAARRRSLPSTTSLPAPTARCSPGPPSNNTIWETHPHRDKGSPMWSARLRQGRERPIRRALRQSRQATGSVGHPRAIYLQHASDPIAWWNVDLLVRQPDWLKEPRGYDLSPQMEWIPIVTFFRCLPTWRLRSMCPTDTATSMSKMSPTHGRNPPTAGVDTREDRKVAAAAVQRRKRLDQVQRAERSDRGSADSFGLQRVVSADDVGGAVQARSTSDAAARLEV